MWNSTSRLAGPRPGCRCMLHARAIWNDERRVAAFRRLVVWVAGVLLRETLEGGAQCEP